MHYTTRPIVWPPRPDTYPRRWHPFSASWSQTMTLLERELRQLDGSAVIFGVSLRERDIRLDGKPRSDAPEPGHPGVEISFDSKHGRLTYAPTGKTTSARSRSVSSHCEPSIGSAWRRAASSTPAGKSCRRVSAAAS